MLPEIKNKIHNHLEQYSFIDTLSDGYYFDINNYPRKNLGTRYVHYSQATHELIITHINTGKVHVLNLLTSQLRAFHVHDVSVRSSTTYDYKIVNASWDGSVSIVSLNSLKLISKLQDSGQGRTPYVTTSTDGEFCFSFSYDDDLRPGIPNCVRKYRISDGKLIRRFPLSGLHLEGRRCGSVEEISGNLLFCISDSGYLNVYNHETSEMLTEKFFNDLLESLVVISGNKLVFAGERGALFVTDFAGSLLTKIPKGHNSSVSQMFVHPGKPEIISVSFDGTVKRWNLLPLNTVCPKLELLETIQINESLWSATIIKNLLVTGGDRGDIHLFNINKSNAESVGRLLIFDDQFVLISADKKKFFASDLSLIQVRKIDGTPVYGQLADYLINSTCSFKFFHDVFNEQDLKELSNNPTGYLQLAQ